MRLKLASALVAVAALAGCSSTNVMAPIDDRTGTMGSVAHEAPVVQEEPAAQTRALDDLETGSVHYRPRAAVTDSGRLHIVAEGETLYKIGVRYGIDPTAIARLNGIKDPTTLVVGRALKLPESTRKAVEAAPVVAPKAAEPEVAAPVTAAPEATPAVEQPAVQEVAPAPRVTVEVAKRPDSPEQIAQKELEKQQAKREAAARGEMKIAWPIRGEVISTFEENGMGIDIAGTMGESIHCVLDGTVQYVGNNTKGYGQFLIVRHNVRLPGKGSMPLITVYGNTSKVLVRVNERVRAGQVIARMGSSDADRVKLRFELRQGKPIDPMPYLEE